jgi:hypothetical protein
MSEALSMVFPADARVHADLRLVTWHPHGVLDGSLAREVFAFIEAEESTTLAPFDRFTDLSGLTGIRLSLDEIEALAQRRMAHYDGPKVKSAMLADNALAFCVAELYGRLMRSSEIEVQVFCLLTSATVWLGQPIEVLVTSR